MVKNECLNRNQPIEDTAILAYLDGVIVPSMAEHLNVCHFCLAEGEALTTMAAFIETAVYRRHCPDSDFLWDYIHQHVQLDLPQQRHLAICTACQKEMLLIRKAAPRWQQLAEPAPADSWITGIERYGRRLLDAILQPPRRSLPVTLRGQAVDERLYQVEDFQIIMVKIPPIAKEAIWCVAGQLLSRRQPLSRFLGHITVQLGETVVYEEPIDELGYFECGQLSPGNYQVTINLVSQPESFTIREFPIP